MKDAKTMSKSELEAALDTHNQAASDAYNTSALVACPHCSRTFLPERLEIHNRLCTAEKPMVRTVKGGGPKLGAGE